MSEEKLAVASRSISAELLCRHNCSTGCGDLERKVGGGGAEIFYYYSKVELCWPSLSLCAALMNSCSKQSSSLFQGFWSLYPTETAPAAASKQQQPNDKLKAACYAAFQMIFARLHNTLGGRFVIGSPTGSFFFLMNEAMHGSKFDWHRGAGEGGVPCFSPPPPK